jgi:hypothetical protein
MSSSATASSAKSDLPARSVVIVAMSAGDAALGARQSESTTSSEVAELHAAVGTSPRSTARNAVEARALRGPRPAGADSVDASNHRRAAVVFGCS